jgi:trimeric autotransporter adhesin
MKRTLLMASMLVGMFDQASHAAAAEFNYHGSLQDAGKPAEGSYDIELTLYSASSGGGVIGGPLIMNKVPVHNGSFSTQADFGPLTKSVSQAYVSVRVRTAGQGEFVALNTREQVDTTAASSVCPGAWTLQGNANVGSSFTPFLGTTDANDPLIFEVGGAVAGVIAGSGDGTYPSSPNIVFGDFANTVATGIGGATIAGGGSTGNANSVQADFATVSGGVSNTASGKYSTVSGGSDNEATDYAAVVGGQENISSGTFAAIGGGAENSASGAFSTVLGGYSNAASGTSSTVAGGVGNKAGGDFSFAGGEAASVRDSTSAGNSGSCTPAINCGDYGTFVWNGSPTSTFTSTGPEQFLINSPKGVAINGTPSNPSVELTIHAGSADAFAGNSDIALLSNTNEGYEITATHGSGASSADDSILEIGRTSTSGVYNEVLQINANGSLQTVNDSPLKPTAGAWVGSSDRRIKNNIVSIDNALDTVMRLHPVSFRYNADYRASEGNLADKPYVGFVAQEFAEVFPDSVISTGKPVPGAAKDDAPILGLDPTPALITTVAAVQELSVHDQASTDRIIALEKGNAALEQQNAALRSKVDKLSARLDAIERKQGE